MCQPQQTLSYLFNWALADTLITPANPTITEDAHKGFAGGLDKPTAVLPDCQIPARLAYCLKP